MLLAHLVATSQRVGAASARRAKVRELAAFLKELAPGEIEIAVLYLSGDIAQGRIGITFKTLRAAADSDTAEGDEQPLSIGDVDRSLAAIAGMRGAGSAARRTEALQALFSRASNDQREFLARLVGGELRQGALIGIMLEAIAAAADIPVAQIRRAAMYSKSLGPWHGSRCWRAPIPWRYSRWNCSCPLHPCWRKPPPMSAKR